MLPSFGPRLGKQSSWHCSGSSLCIPTPKEKVEVVQQQLKLSVSLLTSPPPSPHLTRWPLRQLLFLEPSSFTHPLIPSAQSSSLFTMSATTVFRASGRLCSRGALASFRVRESVAYVSVLVDNSSALVLTNTCATEEPLPFPPSQDTMPRNVGTDPMSTRQRHDHD